jgi:hypothetical protein
MQQSSDDHIRLALGHVCAALQGLEGSIHEAYAEAAYKSRISNYGNICAKRTLLHRVHADLRLLERSVSAPGVLAADQSS